MKKITKGHYNETFKNIEFDIIKEDELEGNFKWAVVFKNYDLGCDIFAETEYDQLYSSKKEALDMSKTMINEYSENNL